MAERTRLSVAKSRAVTGVIMLAVSAIYLWQALHLPVGQMNAPGPGLFPLFVSAIIFVAGIVTFGDGILMMRADTAYDLPLGWPLLRSLVVLGALLFLALLLPVTGRIVTPFFTMLIVILTLSGRGWVHALLWSALLTAAIWLLFVEVLGVPLPRGVLLRW